MPSTFSMNFILKSLLLKKRETDHEAATQSERLRDPPLDRDWPVEKRRVRGFRSVRVKALHAHPPLPRPSFPGGGGWAIQTRGGVIKARDGGTPLIIPNSVRWGLFRMSAEQNSIWAPAQTNKQTPCSRWLAEGGAAGSFGPRVSWMNKTGGILNEMNSRGKSK